LRAEGADEREARDAADLIVALLPVGRDVCVTPELVRAARSGDVLAVRCLLAEEVEPDPDEVEALREYDADPDKRTFTSEQVRQILGDI